MIIAIASLSLILLGIWFLPSLLLRHLQVRCLMRFCADRRAIVLTYDDGPSRETTPALLDLFAQRGVLATFFMIGSRAETHPDVVSRLLAEGHEIGNHTRYHLNAWKTWPSSAIQDIRVGRQTLARLGVPPGLFRPPYGKATIATLLEAWLHQERLAFWTVDTRDSWERPRSVAEVLEMLASSGGGVVLMHDFSYAPRGMAGHRHPEHVLEMTRAIIDFAFAQNYTLLRFDDLSSVSSQKPKSG